MNRFCISLTLAGALLAATAGAAPQPRQDAKAQPPARTRTYGSAPQAPDRPASANTAAPAPRVTPAPPTEQPTLQRDNVMWPGARTTIGPGTSFPGSGF